MLETYIQQLGCFRNICTRKSRSLCLRRCGLHICSSRFISLIAKRLKSYPYIRMIRHHKADVPAFQVVVHKTLQASHKGSPEVKQSGLQRVFCRLSTSLCCRIDQRRLPGWKCIGSGGKAAWKIFLLSDVCFSIQYRRIPRMHSMVCSLVLVSENQLKWNAYCLIHCQNKWNSSLLWF